jgi:nitrogenase molybdenum-iron protein alpha/beta subunit
MTGAVSCLAGIEGMGVVIHGSSGCYYYPATVLRRELHCTFLIEEDIIFGAGQRLRELITDIRSRYGAIAVVHTCTPAIIGDDIADFPGMQDIIMIDSPGFLGTFEEGYLRAHDSLPVSVEPSKKSVNLDGINLLDPFTSGNIMEATRILMNAGIAVSAVFSSCRLEQLSQISPATVSANPDLSGVWGENLGSLLGIDQTTDTILGFVERGYDGNPDGILREAESAEQQIVRSCDKYLQRFDPPSVALFGGFSYTIFAARMLEKYLDASITCIGSRNRPGPSCFRVTAAGSLAVVKDMIEQDPPDLIIGSSFERMIRPSAAFVPFTYPLRGMVRLRARPLVGVQGELGLMEEVLNVCMDRTVHGPDETANALENSRSLAVNDR